MSTARGMGPSLNLLLREQHQERGGTELLRDGFAKEATPVGVWSFAQCLISYVAVTLPADLGGGAGTALRIAYDGVNAFGYVYQAVLTVARTFGPLLYMRGDGTRVPKLADGSGAVVWTGTSSTTWQKISVSFVAAHAWFEPRCENLAAGGYVELCCASVQEVLQVTWDSSDYVSTDAFIGSNRGGAQECLSICKLEHVDRHTGAVSTVADFSASPGAGAVYTLPTGWVYQCASGSRTTQTSASTLVTGIAANQAPAKSVTGTAGSFGVGLEKAATNICLQSNAFNVVPWQISTPFLTMGDTTGPDGVAGTGARIAPTLNTDTLIQVMPCVASTSYTFSLWVKQNNLSYLEMRAYDVSGGANIVLTDVTAQLVVGEWRRVQITFTTPVGCVSLRIYLLWHLAAPTGYAWISDAQVEASKYPTSYIPTAAATVTRAAAILTAPQDEANTHSGKIPRLTVRPWFTQAEAALDAHAEDDSRGPCFWEVSSTKFAFEVRGKGRIASLACTFSRDQEIVLRADVDEATNLMTLVVSGATTGNGTFQSYCAPKAIFANGNGYTAGTFYSQLVPRGVTAAVTIGKYLTDLTKSTIAGLNGYVFLALNVHPDSYALGTSFVQIGAGLTWMTGGLLLYNDPANRRFILYWGSSASSVNAPNNSAHPGVRTVCGVADGGTLYLYVDGRLVGTSGPFATPVYRTDLHLLGDPPLTYNGVKGDLYGFRMGVTPITAQQVAILHAQAMKDLST